MKVLSFNFLFIFFNKTKHEMSPWGIEQYWILFRLPDTYTTYPKVPKNINKVFFCLFLLFTMISISCRYIFIKFASIILNSKQSHHHRIVLFCCSCFHDNFHHLFVVVPHYSLNCPWFILFSRRNFANGLLCCCSRCGIELSWIKKLKFVRLDIHDIN